MISEHASPLEALGGVDSGGQNVYVGKLSEHLAQRGIEVDVVTRRDSIELPPVVTVAEGVRVIHIPAGPTHFVQKEHLLPFMDEFSEHCARLARVHRYSLVHANFFMSGLVGLKLQRALGLPLVVTFHALGKVRRLHQRDADGFPDRRFTIEEALAKRSDAIIAECPQDRDDLINLYNADPANISTIPCGYDPQEFPPISKVEARQYLGLPQGAFVVLQLGRLVRRKGVDTAIQGFAAFQRATSADAMLLVVGGTSDGTASPCLSERNRLELITGDLGIKDKVHFVGPKQRKELCYYFSAADVFISTPWYEPFGITPLESMASGTPVIGSAVGGIKSTVLDGKTGYLVPPRSPMVLAEKLQLLYRNPEMRQRLGQRAQHHVASNYTWDIVAESVSALYRDLVANGTYRALGMAKGRAISRFGENVRPIGKSSLGWTQP
jgi:glycosyltransferase involved in cell wall biosynthesis